MTSRDLKRIAGWVFGVVAVCLPCRHLIPIGGSFYVDWSNHEWMVGYFGEYFRHHYTMPSVLNTSTVGGIAAPLFYGNLFYPLVGLPASVFAPGVVIRIAAIAMFCAQYRLVSRALLRLDAPLYFARIVACLVIWETYPLTNFYNRATLTEFFATTLLVCALSLLVLLVRARDRRERRLYSSGAMFSLALAAGTHPITAMYGGPVFAALVPLFWWLLRDDRARRREIMRSLAPWFAAAAICVAPWFLVSHRYADELIVRSSAADVTVSAGWDDWQSRFFPIPRDPHVVPDVPIEKIGTPYLDAQISLSLLALFLALGVLAIAARKRSWQPAVAFASAGVLFAVFTWLSLSTTGYKALPAIAVMIQYAYRAVTYENLSLLLGVFIIVMGLPDRQWLRSRGVAAVGVAAFALAGVGVIVKWGHIAAVKSDASSPHWRLDANERHALIGVPATFYGLYAYATDRAFRPAVEDSQGAPIVPTEFHVDADKSFGRLRPIYLTLGAPTWVMTNILVFPWSGISIDGVALPASAIYGYFDKLAVRVPAGNHKLVATFDPPLWWRILRPVSVIGIYAWAVFLLAFATRPLRRIFTTRST